MAPRNFLRTNEPPPLQPEYRRNDHIFYRQREEQIELERCPCVDKPNDIKHESGSQSDESPRGVPDIHRKIRVIR